MQIYLEHLRLLTIDRYREAEQSRLAFSSGQPHPAPPPAPVQEHEAVVTSITPAQQQPHTPASWKRAA